MKKSQASKEFIERPYKHLPEKITERLSPRPFTVEDEAKLRFDGKQFTIRIPQKISRELGLKDDGDYYFKFTVKTPPNREGKPTITVEFVEK